MSDAGHQRMAVQARPGAALEVTQAQLALELLVRLLAHPARLARGSQGAQRRAGGQAAEAMLAFARWVPLAREPRFLAGQVLVVALNRAIAHADANSSELGGKRSFGTGAPGHAPPSQGGQHVLSRARLLARHGLAGTPDRESASCASAVHSGASSQAVLAMKRCNWSCPAKPSPAAIGCKLLRAPGPSRPRKQTSAQAWRVLLPIFAWSAPLAVDRFKPLL